MEKILQTCRMNQIGTCCEYTSALALVRSSLYSVAASSINFITKSQEKQTTVLIASLERICLLYSPSSPCLRWFDSSAEWNNSSSSFLSPNCPCFCKSFFFSNFSAAAANAAAALISCRTFKSNFLHVKY